MTTPVLPITVVQLLLFALATSVYADQTKINNYAAARNVASSLYAESQQARPRISTAAFASRLMPTIRSGRLIG